MTRNNGRIQLSARKLVLDRVLPAMACLGGRADWLPHEALDSSRNQERVLHFSSQFYARLYVHLRIKGSLERIRRMNEEIICFYLSKHTLATVLTIDGNNSAIVGKNSDVEAGIVDKLMQLCVPKYSRSKL